MDIVSHARALTQIRDAVLGGARTGHRPRSIVARSWSRALTSGLDPDGSNPRRALSADEHERRQYTSPLATVIGEISHVVARHGDAGTCLLLVTDADGVILWRQSKGRVQLRADSVGCFEGAHWSEDDVGTNAIGTAIKEAAPVNVFAAEHFEQAQTNWYCTAAPIHDPRSGELLGVIDVSGPALTYHPMIAALTGSMVRVAELTLWQDHQASLEQLRSRAGAQLATASGPVLLVDRHGWVASCVGVRPLNRVAEPRAGELMAIPGLGLCRPEEVPGGWLIRPATSETSVRLCLDLSGPLVLKALNGASPWETALTRRHAEILLLLQRAGPDGLTGPALSTALYGDVAHVQTVRAEISRLRRVLGSIVATRPYRLASDLELIIRGDESHALSHPGFVSSSTAPGVRALAGLPLANPAATVPGGRQCRVE